MCAVHMVKDQQGKSDVVYGTIAAKSKSPGYYIKLKSGGYMGPFDSVDKAKAHIQQMKAAQAYHK